MLEPSLSPVFSRAVHWPGAASVSNPLAVTKAYAARFTQLGLHTKPFRIDPAPGGKGFEVHARLLQDAQLRDIIGDTDPEQALRTALRDAKQIFETGEVLRATPRPHGDRPKTLFGSAVDTAEDHAKGGGVL